MDTGGVKRIAVVAANTFRETVRERVLYNLVLFAVLMTVSGLLLRQLSLRQDEKIVKDIGLASMELFGTLIAVFIGVGLVSKEIERRSLHLILAKPVSRDEFLLGKFAGLGLTLFVNVSVMAAGLYATLWACDHAADPRLLLAVYGTFVGLMLVVAIALLFSTLTSSTMAAICTVCMVLAGRFADIIRNVREVVPGVPSWLTSALYYALPNFRNFDLKDRVVHGEAIGFPALAWLGLYGACYMSVVLLLALACFRRRDFQ
jgi:ABC-type transport system involved in multi-copper enzyme maturation permease subunit